MLRVLTEKDRVVVERLDMVKRHTKPTQQNPQGGIVENEGSIHVSNVMPVDPKSTRRPASRQGTSTTSGQVKRRVCAKCGNRSSRPRARPARGKESERRTMADEKKTRREKAASPTTTPSKRRESRCQEGGARQVKAQGEVGQGQGGRGAAEEVATERVKRDGPARLRKLYETEVQPR